MIGVSLVGVVDSLVPQAVWLLKALPEHRPQMAFALTGLVVVAGGKGQSGVMDRPEDVMADPRGWCYGKHEHKAYGSMTAGATGTL